MKKAIFAVSAILLVVALVGLKTYNKLVTTDQAVSAQWAQVENVYQRRADLVPNLVETVKAAASFEKDTYVAVAAARAEAQRLMVGPEVLKDPSAFARFQQAQDGLGSTLSRLIAVAERYPDLKATANFRDLQVQLEGTENRIAVERMRFNEEAQRFNTARQSLPTVWFARIFGSRFNEKAYFRAQASAATAPKVVF